MPFLDIKHVKENLSRWGSMDLQAMDQTLQDLLDPEFQEKVYKVCWNTVLAMLSALAADATVQILHDRCASCKERTRQEWVYDYNRTARFLVVAILTSAINQWWYHQLDITYATATPKDVIAKLTLDTVVLSPLKITLFIFGMGYMERRTMHYIYHDWTRHFENIYLANLMFWPLAQVINFYFVPIQSRLMFISLCSYAWVMFLTFNRYSVPLKESIIRELASERIEHSASEPSEPSSETTPWDWIPRISQSSTSL